MNHEHYMAQALRLARLGRYSTQPNPRVGCVIVKDQQVVGQGWHQQAGGPHAEVHALREAGTQAQQATAYVTLEPCGHFGHTPPCAQALIKAGVQRVVGACFDPNPLVAGQGYQMLQEAGIEVITGVLEEQAIELNAGFMQRMRTGLPRVTIKLAHSLDGRTAMASGESQWITGSAARQDVQRLRAQSCAIISGADSVLIDNPKMTVRYQEAGIELAPALQRQPLRVIIDGQERLTGHEAIFAQAGDILLAQCGTAEARFARAAELGRLSFWQSPQSANQKVNLAALLIELGRLGCNEVLVESGAQLAGAFINAGLCQQLVLYCAPTLLGHQARPLAHLPFTTMAEQIRWHWYDVRQIGDDLRMILRVN